MRWPLVVAVKLATDWFVGQGLLVHCRQGSSAQKIRNALRFHSRETDRMLTLFGAAAVTFMMLMYALERRGPRFILAFAGGCLLSSTYGFLAGTWPFGVVELIWAGIAIHRYREVRSGAAPAGFAEPY